MELYNNNKTKFPEDNGKEKREDDYRREIICVILAHLSSTYSVMLTERTLDSTTERLRPDKIILIHSGIFEPPNLEQSNDICYMKIKMNERVEFKSSQSILNYVDDEDLIIFINIGDVFWYTIRKDLYNILEMGYKCSEGLSYCTLYHYRNCPVDAKTDMSSYDIKYDFSGCFCIGSILKDYFNPLTRKNIIERSGESDDDLSNEDYIFCKYYLPQAEGFIKKYSKPWIFNKGSPRIQTRLSHASHL
ncbi:Hypothetical protein ORPV_1038 [Orpheovirus IHUMI-LCC2]|uniref:Uncharacterized protein n=1 Tax=Orpheovirus IHUMI-LCC2 TaxID=2023057 RepID=A0A2I2L5X1_9VIRU|nr:Hypothetical protein ORPV_1038 [Orpheovirus IHUMI-LCC2]SNW62942.1 Hypothetical protein ORPV_1038 [Orpheovirus IHUMI-LCC2]